MVESELEKAFSTLAQAFNVTETELHEEISVIEQQITNLRDRIAQLNGKQQTLAHDKSSIEEMFSRYCATEGGAGQPKVEF